MKKPDIHEQLHLNAETTKKWQSRKSPYMHCNAPNGNDRVAAKNRKTAVGSDICANIVISIFHKPRLSADDSGVAVLNTAF
ncbi:hypothetical protein [Undibacterium squillarum]|uniref:hypothetical protein n=1 Tax=Undibacterium squillarum TaxID=1131567 RepID=UPI0035B4468E